MSSLEKAWYNGALWPKALMPLESLFACLAKRKANADREHQWQPPVPLWIVGNIAVGGTGKTPFTIALVDALKEQGFKPGIVSRGYKAKPNAFPHFVALSDSADIAGDEPLLLKRRTQVPIVIDPDRSRACKALLAETECDVIISDDGLQHYKMGRTREIVLIDKARGLGNGHCLPVGPLRETPERLQYVDLVVLNGQGDYQYSPSISMNLTSRAVVSLDSDQSLLIDEFKRQHPKIHAVAGIGNPERFFTMLERYGFEIERHPFDDHHALTEQNLTLENGYPILMTEKDAVKCTNFTASLKKRLFYWPVDATFDTALSTIITPWLVEDLANLAKQRTERV